MNKQITIAIVTALLTTSTANAGWQRWSSTREKDPFDNSIKITVSYTESQSSIVLAKCDSKKRGIVLRIVTGLGFKSGYSDLDATLKVAIDGQIIFEDLKGKTGSYGSGVGILGADYPLDKTASFKLAKAMVGARRQVAFRDNLVDRAYLLNAKGSTKAFKQLADCVNNQLGE